MNRKQKTALALFVVAILALFLFPPFFAIDPASGGRIHTSIGFHPVWAPPDEAYASQALFEGGFLPSEGPDVINLEVRRNNVLMVFTLILLLFGVSLALLGFKTRTGNHEKDRA